MSDIDPGPNTGFPAGSEFGNANIQDQPQTQPAGSSTGTEDSAPKDDDKVNVAEEARKVTETNSTSPHPLDGDTVAKAEAFEEKRKSDLDEERAEHIRQRGNVTR